MHSTVSEIFELLGNPLVLIGWPTGSKGTQKRWRHLTAEHMTSSYLAQLPSGNIGVALGEVSGGLCAIDCDRDDFAAAFGAKNPHLQATLQTRGARGRVYWIRLGTQYPRKLFKLRTLAGEDVGEFRANGSQSIVSGIHPKTQRPYEYLVRRPAALVDFQSICWPSDVVPPIGLQKPTEADGRPTEANGSNQKDTDRHLLGSSVVLREPLCASVKSLDDAVRLCLPTVGHQNNTHLFKLARAFRTLELRHGVLTNDQKLSTFLAWHAEAKKRGVLRPEQSRDEYLAEFVRADKRAKYPLGLSSMVLRALELAKTEPYPAEADIFESDAARLLFSLCRKLETLSKGDAWYLAARTAGELIGVSHTAAAGYLAAMVHLGIIRIVQPATTTKAPRYLFI